MKSREIVKRLAESVLPASFRDVVMRSAADAAAIGERREPAPCRGASVTPGRVLRGRPPERNCQARVRAEVSADTDVSPEQPERNIVAHEAEVMSVAQFA